MLQRSLLSGLQTPPDVLHQIIVTVHMVQFHSVNPWQKLWISSTDRMGYRVNKKSVSLNASPGHLFIRVATATLRGGTLLCFGCNSTSSDVMGMPLCEVIHDQSSHSYINATMNKSTRALSVSSHPADVVKVSISSFLTNCQSFIEVPQQSTHSF